MTGSQRSPVILIHGIRTDGTWQKQFADALSDEQVSLPHHTHDFGRFSLWRFMSRREREHRVDAFYNWYAAIRSRVISQRGPRGDFRPSVVAHSFGSYIVGHALRKYPDMTVSRVVFCGSILPVDFDWANLIARNQLWEVVNDHGAMDFWARHASWLVPDAGQSGASGFTLESPLIVNRSFGYHRHSDYFREGHYESWIEILRRPPLGFHTLRSSQLDEVRWRQIKAELRALDRLAFGTNGIIVDETRSTSWLRVNPDIYTILADTNGRAHGYLNAMPLNEETFNAIVQGVRDDNSVEARDIVTYQHDAVVDLYLMSINIHPTSRRLGDGVNQLAFHQLLFGLLSHLEALARERGIVVRRMGAVAWTDEGARLCRLLGLQPVGSDPQGHQTFLLRLDQDLPKQAHKLIHRLQRLYRSL